MFALVFLSILVIFALGLFPDSSVTLPSIRPVEHTLFLGWGRSDDIDVFLNVLLFVPLGFSLTGLVCQKARYGLAQTLLCVLGLSFALSYSVEALQVFIPSRFSSFVDVLSNCTGGLLGFVWFRLWAKRKLQLSLFGYVIVAFLVSFRLQQTTGFSNWDEGYSMLLGNERTADGPWRGRVAELFIADRAISPPEVMRLASGGSPVALFGNSLVGFYRLKGLRGYRDEMGHLPDLVWKGEPNDEQESEGVVLGSNGWLESNAAVSYLARRLMASSQFTLALTVATADTIQWKTARIVSLSEDPNRRNFTLGQLGSDLVFRLRTRLPETMESSPNS